MKKAVVICVFLSTVAASIPCRADAVALDKGEKAPHAGILLTPEDAASIMAEKESTPGRIEIEKQKAAAEANATCKLKLTQQDIAAKEASLALDAQLKLAMNSNQVLKKQLDDAASSSKWSTLHTVAAAVGGIIIGATTAVIVTKVTH